MIAAVTRSPKWRKKLSSALKGPIFPAAVDISGKHGEYVHFRMRTPKRFAPKSYRTISAGERGTKLRIACPKNHHHSGRCAVGMQLQGVLVPKNRVVKVIRAFARSNKRFASNPTLMTVMNPGYDKNPVDVQYEPKEKMYKVFRSNPKKKATKRRKKRKIRHRDNAAVPLFRNNSMDVDQVSAGYYPNQADTTSSGYFPNPMDIATGVSRGSIGSPGTGASAIFNNNPQHYCENPSHPYCENPEHMEEASPADFAGYDDNPHISEGDYVRNKSRVTTGHEIDLEAGQLGRVEGRSRFMGDTLFHVTFYGDEGTKSFKFFEHELTKEPTQLGDGFQSNPYRPRGPRALEQYGAGNEYSMNRGHKEVQALHKQPVKRRSYPGGGKKVKIPIKKFEMWLNKNGSPDEKRRYKKELAAYKRFHKGGSPTHITRRMVDVGAGSKKIGTAFAYSMGKSPFEPYITPKGSKKGTNKPYLHEYQTMPHGLATSGGKLIMKPLDGGAKVTDWIHG
jgi:hypothetical protein